MLRPGRIVYFTRTRLVITAVIVLLIGGLLGIRTLATFNAHTTNPNNVFATGTMIMTNVAGTALDGTANCTGNTYDDECATLFNASSTDFIPGDAAKSNTVTITYKGDMQTSTFGLYADQYDSGNGSSDFCTADVPADSVQLQILQGSTVIYPPDGEITDYGNLAAFHTAYPSSSQMLSLNGGADGDGDAGVWTTGDSSVFTIKVKLASDVDSTYQDCQSSADLVWYASQ